MTLKLLDQEMQHQNGPETGPESGIQTKLISIASILMAVKIF